MIKFLTFMLFFSNWANASVRNFDVPQGTWIFQNHYILNKLRMAEEVPAPDKKPSARVVALRKQGFQCIHKNPRLYLCTKFVTDAKLTPAQEDFIFKGFQGFKIDFAPTENKPTITFDGSVQTDYQMKQNVKVLSFQYASYGVTVMNSGATYFKMVGASDEEPTLIFSLIEKSFGLPVILQTTVGEQTWGYYLDVLVEPDSY